MWRRQQFQLPQNLSTYSFRMNTLISIKHEMKVVFERKGLRRLRMLCPMQRANQSVKVKSSEKIFMKYTLIFPPMHLLLETN